MFLEKAVMGFVLAAALLQYVSAAAITSFPAWTAPSPSDKRSPCPGLNSLANHGILPHNGRGLTIPQLAVALKQGFNVGLDFSTAIGAAGLLSSKDLLSLSFDLDDLDEHNFPIEHDASLSRADFNLNSGDNHSFNQSIFDEVLAFYDGMDETSIAVAAKAKFARVKEESGRDPKFSYTPRQFVLSYGETALYLSVMGDPITGVAPLDYVRIFFEEERLPYAEGWRPSAVETNLLTLGDMVVQLSAASGEPVPEGFILVGSTYAQILAGI